MASFKFTATSSLLQKEGPGSINHMTVVSIGDVIECYNDGTNEYYNTTTGLEFMMSVKDEQSIR